LTCKIINKKENILFLSLVADLPPMNNPTSNHAGFQLRSSEPDPTSTLSSKSLPHVDISDRQISTVLKVITSNILQEEAFTNLFDFSSDPSLPNSSLRPRYHSLDCNPADDEDEITTLARELHAMVLHSQNRNKAKDDEPVADDYLKNEVQEAFKHTDGAIVLPTDMSSLEDVLDNARHLDKRTESETSSCCSSLGDSLLYYKTRAKKLSGAN